MVQIFTVFVVLVCAADASQAANGTQSVQDGTFEGPEYQDLEASGRKLLADYSLLDSYWNSVISKIKLPKFPTLPKRETLVLTSTVVVQETKLIPVYSSCVKFRNIKSFCNGYLETITPSALPTIIVSRESYTHNVRHKSSDTEEHAAVTGEEYINPSSTQPLIEATTTAVYRSARKNIILGSELDYDYEYMKPENWKDSETATPKLEDVKKIKLVKPTGPTFGSLGPKYEIVTEYLTQTKVKEYTDHAQTATIIYSNCLPAKVKLPVCDKLMINYPLSETLFPILHQAETRTKPDKRKKIEAEVEKTVRKVHDTVNKFRLSNPYGVLGISPENPAVEPYDMMNSNSVPSLVKTASLLSH